MLHKQCNPFALASQVPVQPPAGRCYGRLVCSVCRPGGDGP